MYNFNTVIDRTKSEATKWDRYKIGSDVLPMWLADMDLPVSNEIKKALVKRANHPIYGYSDRGKQYYEVFAQRFQDRFHYNIHADEVILSTGVIYSITASIQLFTNQGDSILIPTPCYHPFIDCVKNSKRKVIHVKMKEHLQYYEMDFQMLEKVVDDTVKAIILCNPHNPTGRVFTQKELKQLSDFCERHQLLIFSDEIHCDFLYDTDFIPIMNVSEYTKYHTIAYVSPTKAFNLAGLKVSAIFLKQPQMKKALKEYCAHIGISSINIFAMEAVKAAYEKSDVWQREALAYIDENRRIIERFVQTHCEQIQAAQPQGTYFYWLCFAKDIHAELMQNTHIICSDGNEFGDFYATYERLNFACPKQMILEALQRLERFLQHLEERERRI